MTFQGDKPIELTEEWLAGETLPRGDNWPEVLGERGSGAGSVYEKKRREENRVRE